MKDFTQYSNPLSDEYKPIFFRLDSEDAIQSFEKFLQERQGITVYDTMLSQLCELVKSLNPKVKFSKPALEETALAHLRGKDINTYGIWVYYPWNNRMLHLLDEAEFTEVRTNRNQYKITRDERDYLATKKIGIIGLSVGQSIALSLAMERTFGELRIADFDILELSNYNRIRTPLHNMCVPKVVAVAREIAEIDPFLKVVCFPDGLTDENINDFFTGGGKLDLLVDECDGLDMKIISRQKARSLQIPVIMDTSDKGMLDVERFDLEPNRPILHGLVGDIDASKIKGLTNEQKIPYMLPMIGAEQISPRLKASMMEVEQTINTWPQLASSVILGGAVGADVSRRILLNQFHDSGRYYIDLDELIGDKDKKQTLPSYGEKPPKLTESDVKQIAAQYKGPAHQNSTIEKSAVNTLVELACLAPTGGNTQPWKWLYENGRLYLVHDQHYSYSLLDYAHLGSYVGFGAAIESLELKANSMGLKCDVTYFPEGENSKLIAVIDINKATEPQPQDDLVNYINLRLTNRNAGHYEPMPDADKDALKKAAEKIKGASVQFITDRDKIMELGNVVAGADKVRMMHPMGHSDTFFSEMRWTLEENLRTRDGIDIATVGASPSDEAGFAIAKDYRAIKLLRDWKKGSAFEKLIMKAAEPASAIGLVTMPGFSNMDYLLGGRAVQRVWLMSTKLGYAFQPMSVPLFLFARLLRGNGELLDVDDKDNLAQLKSKYDAILQGYNNTGHIFMFRLGRADEPKVKSLRRKLEDVLIYA